MILTNSVGAVIHKENWVTFMAARCPCLAWHGNESLNQLLGEIRKKKDILNKHLAQLHVTETIIHYAEERPINAVSLAEFWGPTDAVTEDAQEDPLILAWDILNSIARDEYTTAVGQGSHPNSLLDVFQQNGLDDLDSVNIPPPSQTAGPPTPESVVGIVESLSEEVLWTDF